MRKVEIIGTDELDQSPMDILRIQEALRVLIRQVAEQTIIESLLVEIQKGKIRLTVGFSGIQKDSPTYTGYWIALSSRNTEEIAQYWGKDIAHHASELQERIQGILDALCRAPHTP